MRSLAFLLMLLAADAWCMGGSSPLISLVGARYIVITTSGAGSVTVPPGINKATVEAIGAGGNGFGNNTAGNRAGGGGGQYCISNANITVTPGATVFYSVGAAGNNDSWVNTSANSAPGSATVGCLAKAGTNGSSGTAGVGNQAGSIGATTRLGANGTTGTSGRGGGGAGASAAASGQTGGADSTGLTPTTLQGGNGGSSGGNTGNAPGGAGGGATSTGTNPAGSVGRVRIRFNK